MIRHKRKITKQRGSRSVGRGKAKRGRGRGSRMGRGSVKRGQRNIAHIHKYEPERLPRKGFVSIHKQEKTINIRELQNLTDKNEIDVTKFKYDKVLGAGKLTKPLTVIAKSFSEKAKSKIESAGGKAKLLYEEKPSEIKEK